MAGTGSYESLALMHGWIHASTNYAQDQVSCLPVVIRKVRSVAFHLFESNSETMRNAVQQGDTSTQATTTILSPRAAFVFSIRYPYLPTAIEYLRSFPHADDRWRPFPIPRHLAKWKWSSRRTRRLQHRSGGLRWMLLSAAEYCTRKYSCEYNTPLPLPFIFFVSIQEKLRLTPIPVILRPRSRIIKQALLFIARLRAHSPVSRCEYIWVNDKLIWYREPIIHALRESIAVINVETFLPSRLRHRERRSPRDRCYLIIFVSFNRHPIVTDAYIMSFVNATSVQRWVGNARERTIGSSWARRDSRSSSWRSRSIRA